MPAYPAEPLIEDLSAALDEHTDGSPVHPEDIEDLAEFTVGWFEQRGLLPDAPGPILYMLHDLGHGSTFHGVHASLTSAQLRAREIVAERGRNALAGDDWTETVRGGNRCHHWRPMQLGSPVGDFVITETPLLAVD